ncbi:MAG: hypothetical protein P0Y49_11530 [Candidatus Pedobacter colombiensis]|uniref:Uncharacterized protein n=1 Tax=Candidatus Pedobacter colombiensis TaxID=3121371 RepID=A0AAJ5W5D3_9SPHI|nr:DUF6515 family protein [Pedobacter sp.]WEK17425.1 MAG: hypothetical protein P0Y49_11530 [Pedobacter sp.]
MKTAKFKWLFIVGSIILMTGFTTNDALAQRHGGGGGHGASRPSGGSRPPSIGRPGMGRPPGHINRPGYRPGRPIYRPHYSYYRPGFSYRRPYYGFYSYYRPFLGISLSVLPFGYYPFYFGPDQYYYAGGFFYQQADNGYKVVVPPVGAQVPSIPSEAKAISINGQNYYEYKGVYYSTSVDANGKTVYIVAGKDGVLETGGNSNNGMLDESGTALPNVGDIVTELPDNTRDVVIKGVLYYVSEDGVYYEKVMDGNKVTYKVIGVGN